ncbi:MAG: hypothetical protein A2007_01060 [Verrucomicrobia bacterium GWC2_42_7]|nr:MAG: hypothetical protein A2007_01060 [Verrucomicrobia bacterium GWC2_42_7]
MFDRFLGKDNHYKSILNAWTTLEVLSLAQGKWQDACKQAEKQAEKQSNKGDLDVILLPDKSNDNQNNKQKLEDIFEKRKAEQEEKKEKEKTTEEKSVYYRIPLGTLDLDSINRILECIYKEEGENRLFSYNSCVLAEIIVDENGHIDNTQFPQGFPIVISSLAWGLVKLIQYNKVIKKLSKNAALWKLARIGTNLAKIFQQIVIQKRFPGEKECKEIKYDSSLLWKKYVTRMSNFSLETWDKEKKSLESALKNKMHNIVKGRLTQDNLNTLYESIRRFLDLDEIEHFIKEEPKLEQKLGESKLIKPPYFIVAMSASHEDNETDTGEIYPWMINSFYSDVITRTKNALQDKNASPLLKAYLKQGISASERKPLCIEEKEGRDNLIKLLAPTKMPLGKWPDSQPLNLMQQATVNAVREMGDTGMLSVNGPPGTGKTTLLNDVIADIIVRRAEVISNLNNPSDAFTKNQDNLEGNSDFYRLIDSLKGFEMLIVANSNEAVENITKKLPLMQSHCCCDLEYLREYAEYMIKGGNPKKKPNLKEKVNGEKKDCNDSSLAKKNGTKEECWGLISAPLGKRENRQCVAEIIESLCGFDKSIGEPLNKKKFSTDAWEKAKSNFKGIKELIEYEIKGQTFLNGLHGANGAKLEADLYKPNNPNSFINDAFFNRNKEHPYKTIPWENKKISRLREQLFKEAVHLHYLLLNGASSEIKKNGKEIISFLKKSNSIKNAEERLACLFLIIPVLSTTFASAANILRNTKTAFLGYLLIDEAGQGNPQSVVEAISKAKHVISLGDPMQLEPIVTIPSNLVKLIYKSYHIDESIFKDTTSIQTLMDRASPYFGRINGQEVGIPLFVHKRCKNPIFKISNKLAYEDKMIFDREGKDDKLQGHSVWVDVKTDYNLKSKVCDAEIEMAMSLIKEIYLQYNELRGHVFILTPFREVATELRRQLKALISGEIALFGFKLQPSSHPISEKERQKQFKQFIDKTLKSINIGTVHKFQGKESRLVIFVLGAQGKKEAQKWAGGKKVNFLNVALTRAKEAICIIGNCNEWIQHESFSFVKPFLTKWHKDQVVADKERIIVLSTRDPQNTMKTIKG